MLKIYNTLSQKKEPLYPRHKNKVDLFVCGITPYDYAHIGHARTYIIFDMIAKYFKEKGYDIFYLQNITDIDDKIINRAEEKKVSWKVLSRKFEKEYLKDMKSLHIDSVTKYARATEYIEEIVNQVKRLLKKGYAYKIDDGIYYDISKFKDYGKLSKRTVLQAEDSVSRIDDSKDKKNKGDFCLWKYAKPQEPKWKAPFGEGRPGWHIEDTAICEKYFGFQYDIHGGARDLVFPHHEAEIAQMEAISGKKPMVRYWLHTGFLTVKGKKMSKSLGNFITIREFLANYSARALRLFILKTHYRSPIDYSEKEILQTKKQLERIDEFLNKIQNLKNKKESSKTKTKFEILKFKKDFDRAMEDDFNTPKAIATIFDLVNKSNILISQNKITSFYAKEILKFLKDTDKIFNFIFFKESKTKIPFDVITLVNERENCRKHGNWQKADDLREKIKLMGYWVEDTKEGPKIKKLSKKA